MYHCHDCHTTIEPGHAVLRSTDPFAPQPTAWHRDCWELRQAVSEALLPAVVPSQRAAERVAAVAR